MWFTTIQVSPRTIGVMVQEFHWLWAIEWTFFCLEIVSGYCFYLFGKRLSDRLRFRLLVIYSLAAWFSLFWINGILSWQLTPGRFLQTHNVWDGFFNPSFWPSLIFRTVTSMTIASLVACVVINLMPNWSREQRSTLMNKAAHFLAPMLLMPFLGGWYLFSIPADSREWILGGSPAMMLFFALGVMCSGLIGAYAVFGLLRQRLFMNAATSSLLLALAFLATAGGEFVREGSRKPYTIREYLYSNSIAANEVIRLREVGCLADDPYPLQSFDVFPNNQLATGARVFRRQCSICHSVAGANSVVHLTETWTPDQLRLNIAQLQRTKPFMPPFAGTPEEVEALVQWLDWQHVDQPDDWPVSTNPNQLQQIRRWLNEAGPTAIDPT